jgi:hypothetical protein
VSPVRVFPAGFRQSGTAAGDHQKSRNPNNITISQILTRLNALRAKPRISQISRIPNSRFPQNEILNPSVQSV